MTATSFSPHISRQFDQELEDIRARVLAMGGLTEAQIADALEALCDGNSELAEQVIENDIKVNTLEVSIDEDCTQILARRQPAATDLRLVVAVGKTITDLERIGDEAEKIGHMALHLAENQCPKSYYVGLESMGNHVRAMLHDALDAFARMDSESALKVASEDPKVDQEYVAILRQLITYMMEDPRSIARAMDVIWSVRALERIGDHASNICENVIYLVEGKNVRHVSLEEMRKKVRPESD
ncbi:MAG: phosphate signaling complex protein PhoU [Gammaproteobacteria bacterium]|nr:phosphate signaling complex protein PhoU [Gammaproteobacteria bacterium]MCI0591446.1 phosphate signaling complex protein PhoU [Gammaproteobacteria bacterium]